MLNNLIAEFAEFTARENCDPHSDDCKSVEPKLHEHHVSDSEYYIFGAVSFFNAVLPVAYYALSYDYSGDYYKKNPSKSPGKKIEITDIQDVQASQEDQLPQNLM